MREYSAAEAPLSETSQPPVKRSTFSKLKKATFGTKLNKSGTMSNIAVAGIGGANTSSPEVAAGRLGGDVLDVVLRMEVDQKDPAGDTKPYRLLVPALRYERDVADGGVHDGSGGGWI